MMSFALPFALCVLASIFSFEIAITSKLMAFEERSSKASFKSVAPPSSIHKSGGEFLLKLFIRLESVSLICPYSSLASKW